MSEFDRSASDFGTRTALVVAVGAGLLVAATADALPATLLGIVGAFCLARSAGALIEGSNDHRAAGSVGVTVGALLVGGALTLAGPAGALIVVAVAGAVAATGFGTIVSASREADGAVERALRRSVAVLIAVVAVAVVHHLRLPSIALIEGVAVVRAVAASGDLASLVALQIEALAVVATLPYVLALLDGWVPGGRDRVPAAVHRMGLRVERVPRAYWLLLGAQVVLALHPPAAAWFARFLSRLSLLGVVVRAVLRSGVLHVVLAGFMLALVGVAAARLCHELFLQWAGEEPPATFADATGGVVAALVVTVAASLPPAAAALRSRVPPEPVADVGLGGTVLAALAGGLLVCLLVQHVLRWTWSVPVVPDVAGGFALACALLFVATVAGAERGSPGLVVFAGTAASVLVWDLGENATGLGRELGRRAETRRTEVVHATGSVLVGVVGVAVATVATGLLGSVPQPAARWRALLALLLALVALLSFIVLLGDD